MDIRIGDKLISQNSPTFMIAEIGINHNGNIEIAKKLIDEAINSGFDAVKFQKRTVDVVYTPDELEMPRESYFGKTNGDLKRGLEFGFEQYQEISEYCKEKNVIWFASPWDIKSVDFLEDFDVPAHKVASACLTDSILLERIAETNKPVFMSTGMSTMDQIKRAVKVFDPKRLILMHAVSVYPARLDQLNLSWIKNLQDHFPNLLIGYSGHEVGLIPSVVAVAKYNAVCVERHITLDRSTWGTDQSASIEPQGMRNLVKNIRALRVIVGDGEKHVLPEEIPIQKKLRKVN
jgi:N-acetylneuraminate synthase